MILLDFIRAVTSASAVIAERDQAVEDYAEAQCKFLQAQRHKEKLHKELAIKAKLLEQACAANLELEALLAMHGGDAEDARREAWMSWSERLLTKANEQADLAGRRVVVLEAWVAQHGGERDVIYGAAGLPVVADQNPSPVVTEDEVAS